MIAEYLAVLAAIGLPPLVLSFSPRLGLYRHRPALLRAVGIPCVVYWAWDIAATARGHWFFNPQYTLGVRLMGMPVEEWLFFVVLSFVSIFTWESVKFFAQETA